MLALIERLLDAGHAVSLETSGAMDIGGVDPRCSRVLDIKTPGSGEAARNRLENLSLLTANDQVKFVICDRADYEWVRSFIAEHGELARCPVLLSPVHGKLDPAELSGWILEDGLDAREIFVAAKHPKSFVSLDKADHLLSREEDSRYAGQVLIGIGIFLLLLFFMLSSTFSRSEIR